MFEKLAAHVARRAQGRADAHSRTIAVRLAEEAPPDVVVEAADEGVRLSGRDLRSRLVRDPVLRRLSQGGWR